MRLEIENWAEVNLSENVIEIMREAVICYKVGAYRSAYLMSYLTFKQTIRQNVLNAKDKPDAISSDDWDNKVICALKNDDQWEDCINNMINITPDNPKNCLGKVFKFSNREKVKSKYDTWKYTRHSCAHWKTENINEATVVQFWNYMQDNLSEFYVNGGKQYLLNQLCDIYKYFVAEDVGQLDKLLKELNIIYNAETNVLFEEFFKAMNNDFKVNDLNYEFWQRIVNSGYDKIRDGLINLINNEKYNLFFEFYKFFPQIFEFICELNNKYLQQKIIPILEGDYYFEYEECFWPILINILNRNNKIVDINKLSKSYNRLKLIKQIDLKLKDYEIEKLKEYKLFNLFIENAGRDFFANDADSHYNYYRRNNKSDDFIIKCFEYIEWDINIVKNIEYAISTLENSISMRDSSMSIRNGEIRKDSYLQIVHNNESKIKDTIAKECEDISDYENISKYL